MVCTLSSRRARLAQAAQPTVPDWSSLPGDLVRRVGDCFLAAEDLDYYMNFRGVCKKWRSEADDPKEKGFTDHRFVPSKWVLLKRCKDPITENDSITLVNVDTGRFLVRSMPRLRKHCFVGATGGGLFLLGESTYPNQARVVNPFTGSVARFKASIPMGGVWGVAVTTSPMRVFISGKQENIMWADQDSECFREFWVVNLDGPMCMAPVAGNVYLTNLYGSIVSPDVDGSFPTMNTFIPGPEKLHPESLESGRYYLVEGGEDCLFLVTRPWKGLPAELVVRRVDIRRRVLEPVRNVGNRALFVSHIRCLAVDADKFHTIEGGCIYFVDPVINYGRGSYKNSFLTMFRVADGVQECMLDLRAVAGYSCPSTLALLFAEYCNSVPYSELCQMYFEEGEFRDEFEPDEGSSESDDELD